MPSPLTKLSASQKPLFAVAVFAVLTAAAGCSNVLAPRPDFTRYYALNASNSAQTGNGIAVSAALKNDGVRLDSFRLPAFYERSEIIWNTAQNRLAISDADCWLEPLPKAASRLFTQTLAQTLALDWLPDSPASGTGRERRLSVDVFQLEIRPDRSEIRLAARWNFAPSAAANALSAAANCPSRAGTLSFLTPIASPAKPEQIVAALSEAVETLAVKIATQIATP